MGEIGGPPGGGEKYVACAQVEPAARPIVGVDEHAGSFVAALKQGLRAIIGKARIAFRRDIRFRRDDTPVELISQMVGQFIEDFQGRRYAAENLPRIDGGRQQRQPRPLVARGIGKDRPRLDIARS
jgi:hypothetical protein